MRLNQYISGSGYCSRREADRLIQEGKVYVNGRLAMTGQQVTARDQIKVSGKMIKQKQKHVYLILNKPSGIISTTDQSIEGNIVDYVNFSERIFPVGRLDKDSEGLILLTSDGDIVNKILREENEHTKSYEVTVDRSFQDDFLKQMAEGVTIFNPVKKKHVRTLPCEVRRTGPCSFEIILSQGLNRQIRRMTQALGYEVTKLKRIRLMHLHIGNLRTGKWRHLNDAELKKLMLHLQASSNVSTKDSQSHHNESGNRRRNRRRR